MRPDWQLLLAMTKEEFIRGYCERSGVSDLFMREAGQVVVECCCGEGGCEGWAYVSAVVAEGLDTPDGVG